MGIRLFLFDLRVVLCVFNLGTINYGMANCGIILLASLVEVFTINYFS